MYMPSGSQYVVREIHGGTSVFGYRIPVDTGTFMNEHIYYDIINHYLSNLLFAGNYISRRTISSSENRD